MAVTHPTAIRNGIADHVVDQIDVGGTGTIIYRTNANAEAATLTFSATAFGDAAAGVATAAAITSDTSATGGTVDNFIINSGGGTTIIQGSIGTSSADIIISSTNIAAGNTVELTSLTYTAPA